MPNPVRCIAVLTCSLAVAAQDPPNHSKLVYPGANGRLIYVADERGNRIPDFSNCGYQGGGVKLPDVPVKETLDPREGEEDDADRVQAAIDRVAVAADGGAVLLRRGTHRIAGALTIATSGVVLRGEKGTVLIATGKERRTLIVVKGSKGPTAVAGTTRAITDEIVPVGGRTLRVASTRHAFAFGSRIPGPNVFLDCRSTRDYGSSELHHRWSVGGLFDNVHGPLAIQDRQNMGSGHGWSGANYVAWNTEGTLVCQKPPTAQNYAVGHVGKKSADHYPRRRDRWIKAHPDQEVPINFLQQDGHWESHGKHVEPRSLYLKQLEDRLGRQAVGNIGKGKSTPVE